jgi:WD40 repeat protein/serine/threonine protein kinase
MSIGSETSSIPDSGEPSRQQRIAEIVADCSNRLNSGEKVEVTQIVGDHPDLAPELEKALRAISEFKSAIKTDLPHRTIGDYQILREIGRGGMGVVYEGLQVSLNRRVAIKLLPPELLSNPRAVARILHEAKVAASLKHPGICTVHDAGIEDGVPYIAMQFIEGETLASRLSTAMATGIPLPVGTTTHLLSMFDAQESKAKDAGTEVPVKVPQKEEILRILEIMERTARALHAAHEAGFVHRDIKPGNIMVDRSGEPVILDFGLAQDTEGGKRLSVSGELLGTPAYMSPEQIAAGRIQVDRRTDVYSLGVTLYEALTYRLPFDAPTREGIFKKILGGEPPDPRALNRNVSKDLKVVLETALEKDLDRRYGTALDFAEDLRRVKGYEPIRARPAGPILKFRRWAQRNPVVATATLAAFLILVIGLTISLVLLDRVKAERDGKEAALDREKGRRLTTSALYLLPTNPELSLLLAIEGAKRCPDPEANSALLEILSGRQEQKVLVGHRGSVESVEFSPDGKKLLTTADDKTARVWDATTGEQLLVLGGQGSEVNSAAFSPDGRLIGAALNDGTARIWDAFTGQEVMRLDGNEGFLKGFKFSRDGLRVLTTGKEGKAKIWDARTGKELFTLNHGAKVEISAAFSPDGTQVVTASEDSSAARIWSAGTEREPFSLEHESAIYQFGFSPDGKRLITSTYNSLIHIWNLSTGNKEITLEKHDGWVDVVGYNHRADLILTTSANNGMARIWEAETGKELLRLHGHERRINSGSFSTDDERVVTASEDRTARIWNARTGDCLRVLRGHENELNGAAFSMDGRLVATCSYDGTARIWDSEASRDPFTIDTESRIDRKTTRPFSPDGRRLVTPSNGNVARIWDVQTRSLLFTLKGHEKPIYSAEFSSDGQRIVTVSQDNTARVWEATEGKELSILKGHEKPVHCGRFSPDGRLVITGSEDATCRIWDSAAGGDIFVLKGHEGPIREVDLSPDSRRVVTGSGDKTARLWDTITGKEIAVLEGHIGSVWVQFSSDGRTIATFSNRTGDDGPRIWDGHTGYLLHVLKGHEKGEFISDLSLSPDGGLAVSASSDKTARIWDTRTGAELRVLRGHEHWLMSSQFSPDGRRILTVAWDQTARIWDTRTGAQLLTLKEKSERLDYAAFSPDGNHVVTATSFGLRVRIWPVTDILLIASRLMHRSLTPAEMDTYQVESAHRG